MPLAKEAIAAQSSRTAQIRAAKAHRAEMLAIRDSTDGRLQTLLDGEQYARYLRLREAFGDEVRQSVRRHYG